MTSGRWYTSSTGSVVNWSTAVVGGIAQVSIYEVDVVSSDGFPQSTLWASPGTAVSADQIAAAQAASSTGSPPTVRPAPAGVASASGSVDLTPMTAAQATTTSRVGDVVTAEQANTVAVQAGASSTATAVNATTTAVQGVTAAEQATATAVNATTAAVNAVTAAVGTVNSQLNSSIGAGGAQRVTSTRSAFRDGFVTGTVAAPVDSTVWTLRNEAVDNGNGQGHLVLPGGDSMGAGYLRISLSPFSVGTAVHLASTGKYAIPFRHAWGASSSQRILGQEVIYGLAEALDSDALLGLNRLTQPADTPIVGTVTTTGALQTMTVTAHNFKGGDRVVVIGNAERRLNVGPVYVTVVDANTITVPNTLGAGTYTAGGSVRVADPAALANNAAMVNLESTTVTQGTYVTRRSGGKYRTSPSQTVSTSTPTQNSSSPYSDAWIAGSIQEIWANIDEVVWRSWGEGNGSMAGYAKFAQSIPDETQQYRLYARAKNLDNLSRPIARIVSAVKNASSSATITTDVAHGLVVGDQVGILGIRDTTNFPGVGVGAVLTVPSSTTFTVAIGSSATATDTYGGVVEIIQGGVTNPGGISGGYIQSIASTTSGVLAITGNTTISGVAPGDYINLYGMAGTGAAAYEGAFKVLRLNGSVLEVAFTGATFSSITTGGWIIRRTDVRLHFARILDYNRLFAEIVGGRGNASDANNAVPVVMAAQPTVNLNQGAQIGVVAGTTAWTTTALTAGSTYASGAVDRSATATSRFSRERFIFSGTAAALGGVAHVIMTECETSTGTFRETQRLPMPLDGNAHTFEWLHRLEFYKISVVNGSVAQTALYLYSETSRGDGLSPDVLSNLALPITPTAGSTILGSGNITGPTLDLGTNHAWDRVRLQVRVNDTAATTYNMGIQVSADGTNFYPAVNTDGTTGKTSTSATAGTFAMESLISGWRYARGVIVNNSATAGTGTIIANASLVTA